MEQSYHIIS